MKVFDKKEHWEEKVNFVDENNVFVGYDIVECCCEHADWFLSDKVTKSLPEKLNQDRNLEDYVFDKNYFLEVDLDISDEAIENDHYYEFNLEKNMVVFRIVNTKGDEKFLHLFNCHNGYYGHGFEVKHGGEIVKEGRL